ncbi:MAG: ComF family protein [Pseudomonadota bacterium]
MSSIIGKMTKSGIFFREALFDLCFPPFCLSCNESLEDSRVLFCEDCFGKIKFINEPYCICCGRIYSSGENHFCSHCLKKGWHFQRARAVVIYTETVSGAIHAFKFRGRKVALHTFQKMKEQSLCCRDLVEPDIIIPVPLHSRRLRKRGFNQALLLARLFFPAEKGKIKKNLLQRQRDTISQTGLDGMARRKNMRDAFVVCLPDQVRGKNIILVDDVFTTGTTVNECARVLMSAGAKQVDVLTLARVDK